MIRTAWLIVRNAGRRKLRTFLTILGMAIATVAFTVLRTALKSWETSIEISPPDRLITRHAVSFVFTMPISYAEKIARVDGVKAVGYANWFGGLYNNDPKNFVPSMAIGPRQALELYPEFVLPSEQKQQFASQKDACIVGQKLADRFGWKVGDVIRLAGQIYPGDWEFTLVGIYRGREPGVDESSMFFHWDYLDERARQFWSGWGGQVGWYILKISDPSMAAQICQAVDDLFRNSAAQTITETEKAFSLSFFSGVEAIVVGMRVISYLVIGVILLVLANTMMMSARERMSEYALLKTFGFRPRHLGFLIVGEAWVIALLGAALGLVLTFPIADTMGQALSMFFASMKVTTDTMVLAVVMALVVGFLAAAVPWCRAARVPIAQGLRSLG